jgi:hypothetical protein
MDSPAHFTSRRVFLILQMSGKGALDHRSSPAQGYLGGLLGIQDLIFLEVFTLTQARVEKEEENSIIKPT